MRFTGPGKKCHLPTLVICAWQGYKTSFCGLEIAEVFISIEKYVPQFFAKYICPTFPRWRRETYLVIGLSLACLPTNLPAFLPVGLWPVSSTYSISWPCCCCCCCCYDQCHPPSLSHGHASAIKLTLNSWSALTPRLFCKPNKKLCQSYRLSSNHYQAKNYFSLFQYWHSQWRRHSRS